MAHPDKLGKGISGAEVQNLQLMLDPLSTIHSYLSFR